MSFTACLLLLLGVAVIASDLWLARRIRAAIAANRMPLPGFEDYRSGGSPIGIAYNVTKLRKLPAVSELSDPDLIAIKRHARVHYLFVVLLGACLLGLLLLQLVADPSSPGSVDP